MAAIDSTTLIKVTEGGDPIRMVVWIARDISGNDTIDTSAEFATVRVAAIITITNQAQAGCTVIDSHTLAIPSAAGSHDAGWIIAWGSAK